MSSELVRFGVAMDNDLLDRFDALIARRGYATRSEALRDLVRGALVEAHLEADGPAVATLTLVYDHHVRELSERLTAMQHDLGERVVSTLHVHLDHDNCMEVIVMRGPAQLLQRAADGILATKGVQHGARAHRPPRGRRAPRARPRVSAGPARRASRYSPCRRVAAGGAKASA
ncbi:MAG: nickel-responsive transcriptional regulator NikR [Polyangiales bacterium]